MTPAELVFCQQRTSSQPASPPFPLTPPRHFMPQPAQQLLRYIALITLTVFAALIMWQVSRRNVVDGGPGGKQVIESVSELAESRPLVATESFRPQMSEITVTFSGKIRPWETYTLAFEVAGRVKGIGTNQEGKPLDDGDRVTAGQMLARLDDRTFKARTSEAVAGLEEATTDMNRIRELQELNPRAITETEVQEQLTELAMARAQQEIAFKNLEDAVLTSPVDSVISQRKVNLGESVQANQTAFQLVENDHMLLVVDVPESQIYDLQSRARKVAQNDRDQTGDPEERVFRAHVVLEGRNRFGEQRPAIEGEVYRIAQIADVRTGLFEVEIRIPNEDHSLRAGMVATAQIVTDRIEAYQIPETAVIFRGREAYVFTIQNETQPLKAMFWNTGMAEVQKAHRVLLSHWVDQGSRILVPADEYTLDQIIVRGQQRISNGQLVRVIKQASDHHLQEPANRASFSGSGTHPPGSAGRKIKL